ncbi:MAG TPA: hypothetical protein VNL91_04215 [Thermoanaerobaculia bacterium]|nr:hypothetical protein [Thermoanaerobaculia bacterium]
MDPLEVWRRFGAFIAQRAVGDSRKVDLHSSSVAIRAQRAICAEHGPVAALVRLGRIQCWCGDTAILKAEADRAAESAALTSVANDPVWRC